MRIGLMKFGNKKRDPTTSTPSMHSFRGREFYKQKRNRNEIRIPRSNEIRWSNEISIE